MATAFDRITVEPEKCGGKPCIRELRITVRRVFELLVTYPNRESLLSEYPFLEPEDLQQALQYAAAMVDDEQIPPSGSRESSSSGPGSRPLRGANASWFDAVHVADIRLDRADDALISEIARHQAGLVQMVFDQCAGVLRDGAAVSADLDRIRIRRLPLR